MSLSILNVTKINKHVLCLHFCDLFLWSIPFLQSINFQVMREFMTSFFVPNCMFICYFIWNIGYSVYMSRKASIWSCLDYQLLLRHNSPYIIMKLAHNLYVTKLSFEIETVQIIYFLSREKGVNLTINLKLSLNETQNCP